MPKKTILDEDKLAAIKHDIIALGLNNIKLERRYGISTKVIKRLADEMGIKDVLRINNRKNSRPSGNNNSQRIRAIKSYKKYNERYLDDIKSMIERGSGIIEISKYLNRSQSFTEKYLRYNNLRDIVRTNGVENISRIARENGKHGLSGSLSPNYKPIPEKAKIYYTNKVKEGWHSDKIFRGIQDIFPMGYGKWKKFKDGMEIQPIVYSFVGKNNPAYNTSPSKNSGKGINGYFLKRNGEAVLFRSQLECYIFLTLDNEGINFKQSTHRIPYRYKQRDRTYTPDIIFDGSIYEIKPLRMIDMPLNKKKNEVLIAFCKNNNIGYGGFITEDFISKKITADYVLKMIESGKIKLAPKQQKRLIENVRNYIK